MAGKVAANPDAFFKNLGAKWKAGAKEAKSKRGGSEFDDGTYQFKLLKVEAKPSAKGEMQMIYDLLFVNGEYAGQIKKKFSGLEGENSMTYVGMDLMAFNIDPEEIDPASIPDIMKELTETQPYVEARLTTPTGYQNVYLNRMLDPNEVEDEVGGGGDAIEEGSRVTFTKGNKADAGEVTKVVDDETIKVKTDSGKIVTLKIADNEVQLEAAEDADEDTDSEGEEEAEEEAEEEEAGEAELAEGQKVKYTFKGNATQGVIIEVLEDEEKVRVQEHDDEWEPTGKTHKVAAENVAIIPDDEDAEEDAEEDEDEEEEAPAPAKKPGRPAAAAKPAAKPTSKPGRK